MKAKPEERALARAWDGFDAYLFDIDGTLLNCTDATHYFAFCDALKKLSGRELTLEGVTAHGNTDVGILRDALIRAGVPDSHWRGRLRETCDGMGEFVATRQDELCMTVLPQVREVLQHLKRRGAVLGVATGNLERIGSLKLRRAGLLDYFDFAGWSDGHEYRTDVFRSAIAKARKACGGCTTICVVGDTPADISAAHENDLPVIAVATGIYSFGELQGEEPELCVRSMDELLGTHPELTEKKCGDSSPTAQNDTGIRHVLK
jgi:phosphoglycolate phosphatase-like HAD superfamily hydrolase